MASKLFMYMLIPEKKMVNFIMELISNRSFTLKAGTGKHSRIRRLRNGVPHNHLLMALETIDHATLTKRLETRFGITGAALTWLEVIYLQSPSNCGDQGRNIFH